MSDREKTEPGPTAADEFRRALYGDAPIHFCHGGKFVIAGCAGCRRAERKAAKTSRR